MNAEIGAYQPEFDDGQREYDPPFSKPTTRTTTVAAHHLGHVCATASAVNHQGVVDTFSIAGA